MPFFRLPPVDRQHQRRNIPVGLCQLSWVLLTGSQHRLVQPNIVFDGIIGQRDLVRVLQLQTQLRDRPMAGKAAMAEPAQHVPAHTPARHADREFRFGTEGAPPTLARGVWTAHQTVDHLGRPFERPESMIPVVANMHITVADRARAILNCQRNPFECCPRRPTVSHGGPPGCQTLRC